MNIFENFSVDRFLFSLKYMGLGMLCIFIVIGVVILSVLLMNRMSEKLEALNAAKAEGKDEDSSPVYLDPKVSWTVLFLAVAVLLIIALAVILPIA